MLDFVHYGGSLLQVSDHPGSDQDGDGVDSVDIGQDLLPGQRFSSTRPTKTIYARDVDGDTRDPVLHGRFGTVAAMDFYDTATTGISSGSTHESRQGNLSSEEHDTATTGISSGSTAAYGLIWQSGYNQSNTHFPMCHGIGYGTNG